jgi:putative DNA primase/helicase
VAQHGSDIRYVGALGWLLWDGTHWHLDETDQIQLRADQTAQHIALEVEQIEDVVDDAEQHKLMRTALLNHAHSSQYDGRLNAIVKRAKHQPEVVLKPAAFDADPWLLNVQNGTIDLKTGNLRPHQREDYLTKRIPIDYDPVAQCPLWGQFLMQVMCDNVEMVQFLQRAVGYTLTGRTTEQCFFILYGTGANGKSVFLTTVTRLLGGYGKTAEFTTFVASRGEKVRNDLARLAGARLVIASEGDAGHALSESVVKTLTGGDLITARFLHKEHFEFVPAFKLFLATNHKPHIRNPDEGIWRRIRLVPFDKSIPKAERNLHLAYV